MGRQDLVRKRGTSGFSAMGFYRAENYLPNKGLWTRVFFTVFYAADPTHRQPERTGILIEAVQVHLRRSLERVMDT